MRLTAFSVQRFRNIIDSTPVAVEPGVTCLVGENESGKTALLEALWRANPHQDVGFDPHEHYPRWLLTQHRKDGLVDETAPISATFELADADVAAVDAVLGEGVVTGGEFTYSVTYDGASIAWLDVDPVRAVANLLDALQVRSEVKEALSSAKGFEALAEAVQQEIERRSGAEAVGDPQEGRDPDEERTAILADLRRVQAEVPETSAWQQAASLLQERMPTFFYFSDYHILPGRVALDELGKADDQPGATGLQTARALLGLAGTSAAALGGDQYEARKAELEAVSNDLTQQVHTYWRQNPDLSVDIDVDQVPVKPGARQGLVPQAVARYLDVRVKDHRHGFTNNFGQRSSGFQSFFSFLAAFSEFESRERDFVVLLDEPAQTLHGRAQADFLRFIEQRLAPVGQVVYTTHSPFMVDVGRIERVRLVEDKGPDTGAVVSTDVLSVQPETLFPLRAALGYDVARSTFAGDAHLVVATIADFTLLTVLSDHLNAIGRQGLAPEWQVVPAGGVATIPAVVSLTGGAPDVTVVVDSGTHGAGRLERLAHSGLLDGQRVVAVGQVLDRDSADVEDLFAEADYLAIYNGALGTRHRQGDLPPGERIVERLRLLDGRDVPEQGRPADHLLRRRNRLLRRFSGTTLQQFEELFATVNATLR